MIPVKNIGRGPLYVDGAGFIPSGDTGDAADSDHTHALIEAGDLLRMPDEPKAEARQRPAARAAEDKE